MHYLYFCLFFISHNFKIYLKQRVTLVRAKERADSATTLQHTATHMQRTAPYTATHPASRNTLQQTCNALQCTLQHTQCHLHCGQEYLYVSPCVRGANEPCHATSQSDLTTKKQGLPGVAQRKDNSTCMYGVATISRMLKNICLFAEYRSLL